RELRPDGLALRFLLRACERGVAAIPSRNALLTCRVVAGATAPQDLLKLALLRGRRPQLLLVGLAACGLIAHFCVFPPGTTTSGGQQAVWRKPGAPHRQGKSPAACGGLQPDAVSVEQPQMFQCDTPPWTYCVRRSAEWRAGAGRRAARRAHV